MHKMKTTVGVLISLFLFTSVLFIVSDSPCKADENWIYVDIAQRYPGQANGTEYNPYKTIQDAIDAASDGDVIKVLPGEYGQDLTIDKSVTIMNDNRDTTVIMSSTKNSYIIKITASSVSLEGFTIEDGTNTSHRKGVIHIQSGANDVAIINNLFNHSANGYLVYIDGADDSVISNNTAEAGSRGIKISNSNSNSIYDNQIENCTKEPGIKLFSSNNNQIEKNILRNNIYGVSLQDSSYNIIKNNTIYENTITGVIIESGDFNDILLNTVYSNIMKGIQFSGSNNYVYSNSVYGNNIGVYIGASGSDSTVTNCTIYDQLSYGLFAAVSSYDNTIYNNSFRTNAGGNAHENGNNQWDNGTLGNYWDDFYGPDPNNRNCTLSPGAIEFSYRKHGGSDNHPKGIYNIQPGVSSPSPANLAEQVARQPTLKVTALDPDPSNYKQRMDIHFYYVGTDGSNNYIGTHSNVVSGNKASQWFSSTTDTGNPVYSYRGLGYDYVGVWYVEIEDEYYKNKSAEWVFSTMNTPVNNIIPTVKFEAPTTVQLGDTVSFDASACNDSDGEIVFWRWSFGDNENLLNKITPTHEYKNTGIVTVSLLIIDGGGASNITSKNITVTENTNRPPTPIIGGPYSGTAGALVQFSS
ncbi:MAG: right-handed parallel beta-helix repeat-containing protein, partial [Thermoplasmatales archaeon]|nr:right-handed parallel beta-helix repeat-containing protein [Thermoplasmatales archaeon]